MLPKIGILAPFITMDCISHFMYDGFDAGAPVGCLITEPFALDILDPIFDAITLRWLAVSGRRLL